MSANAPASSSQGNAPKPRSPVERAIVWGGIGILLVAVLVEFTARSSYSQARDTLLAKMKQADEGETPVKKADVQKAVGGKEPVIEDVSAKNLANAAKKVEKYSWWSLNPSANRVLLVYYGHGDDPDVLSVGTTEEETAEAKYKADAAIGGEGAVTETPEAVTAAEPAGAGAETKAADETKKDEPKKEEEPKANADEKKE